MLRIICAAAFLIALSLTANAQDVHGFGATTISSHEKQAVAVHQRGRSVARHSGVRSVGKVLGDPRPAKWCAWYLRRKLAIAKTEFPKWQENLAAAFRFIGSPAPKNCTNCIAVWWHHVGLIHP